jgi:macrodomain Ter protein organizer (MatP/YcbG family)
LNLVTLIHAKGLQPEIIQKLVQYSLSPEMEAKLLDDLVRKRNQHLLEEIQSHLPLSDNIMVPWGVAHMPGIAKEIQKLGFQLSDTHEYMVIRFGGSGNQGKVVKP